MFKLGVAVYFNVIPENIIQSNKYKTALHYAFFSFSASRSNLLRDARISA